jgi:glycine hydroxymethyltransferase
MDLTHGGHLTHGHPLTLPAKIYKFVRYGTEPDGSIDMEKVRKLALEHKPKLILCGYSSYSRDLDYKGFKRVADEVGAYTMADIAHIAGLIAAGLMKNPVPIFDIVTTTTHKTLRGPRGGMIMCKKELAEKIDKAVFPGVQGGPHENNIAALAVALDEASRPEFKSYAAQIMKNAKALCDALRERGMKIMFGGTENHLVLADVTPLGTTGKQAQVELESVGIVLNKNVIPNDPRKPFDPSGIRLGTPAVTTRGMKEKDMVKIADMITRVLKGIGDESAKSAVRAEVSEMLESFPIYRGMKYG